ncbi:MAG: rhodanese-like domain-containing protein, partial [Thermoproteota archaeon]|nr:rhodanese-like domain-containing protein [Thermoproteota archaeon]
LKKWIDTKQDITILDVRRESELNEGYIKDSIHIYLGKVEKEANKLPRDKPVFVICKTGNRSSFGASILLREGFSQVYNILGGTDAWKKDGFPLIK